MSILEEKQEGKPNHTGLSPRSVIMDRDWTPRVSTNQRTSITRRGPFHNPIQIPDLHCVPEKCPSPPYPSLSQLRFPTTDPKKTPTSPGQNFKRKEVKSTTPCIKKSPTSPGQNFKRKATLNQSTQKPKQPPPRL